MFPTPIEKTSPASQWIYKVALPIALILWLLPLLAVAMTSVRSAGDINAGNYWGWPT
ncbi:MAG: carbohydrate ABC transporter permease, partial [Pseudomonadota bacterium]|nr:carbohydrate ABC transporter permease [Pseudomonadota bacterium]